jgi:hypothetical protein
MLHRLALSTIIAASFLCIDRPAHASGDVPPDATICPDLFAALCVAPGVCADVCVTLCDGDDATDSSLDCKSCINASAKSEDVACTAAMAPTTVYDCHADYGMPFCSGGEAESGCNGDGVCDEGLACFECCPPHADALPHDDGLSYCGAAL